MEKIVNGALKFMRQDYLENEDLFKNLAHKQTPTTLFVGCADSRVVPNLITNTLPGELFVVRNIANIVPKYRVSSDFVATTAAIEYAICSLSIKNIIVCGHSNCGGCSALYYDEKKLENIPNVKKWLDILKPIKEEILKLNLSDKAKISWLTERLNIINSLNNLYTFPKVKEGVKNGEIKLFGWHYVIEKGLVYAYDEKKQNFYLLKGM